MTKRLSIFFVTVLTFLFIPTVVFAKVTLTPATSLINTNPIFDLGIPSGNDMPTTDVRIIIPKGVAQVIPNVKPGWYATVSTTTTNQTQIDWTGGSIPAGMRDDFLFSAQMPSQPTQLHWNVYQTYIDGSVVSWDKTPSQNSNGTTPYVTTNVLTPSQIISPTTTPTEEHTSQKADLAIFLSIMSILVGSVAVSFTRRQKQTSAKIKH